MESIFDNARFGDKFATKDGRTAVFVKSRLDYACESFRYVTLFVEEDDNLKGSGLIDYDLSGKVHGNNNDDLTIVGKKISEELDDSELHKKAKMFWSNLQLFASAPHVIEGWDNFVMGFEKGYRIGYSEAKDGVKNYEMTYTGLREVQ